MSPAFHPLPENMVWERLVQAGESHSWRLFEAAFPHFPEPAWHDAPSGYRWLLSMVPDRAELLQMMKLVEPDPGRRKRMLKQFQYLRDTIRMEIVGDDGCRVIIFGVQMSRKHLPDIVCFTFVSRDGDDVHTEFAVRLILFADLLIEQINAS